MFLSERTLNSREKTRANSQIPVNSRAIVQPFINIASRSERLLNSPALNSQSSRTSNPKFCIQIINTGIEPIDFPQSRKSKMAASSSDPGASIVAVANVGDALSKSMNEFLDEWPTRRSRFWELDAETHPVKIMLMHLAESVNRYGNDVGFDENAVKPVLDVVKIAFGKVAKALEKAGVGKGEEGEKVVENGDGGKAKEQERDDKDKSAKWVWVADDAFAEAIGGTKGIDQIVRLLKIEKGILVSLNRAVRYMAFRKLEKE